MPPYIEIVAKTVAHALTKACETLKISKDQLKHEVISYGATGIFGLVGIKKARIRVAVPGIQEPEPPALFSAETAEVQTVERIEAVQPPDDVEKVDPERIDIDAKVLPDYVDHGRQFLQKIVDSLTHDAEVVVKSTGKQIVYAITGENTAALIGKRGQTLEAMQYLLKKIVNRSAENRIRIVVDIEGYFSKRQDELQKQALRFAEKVCQNRKSAVMGRFNPQDRKIIHMALKNDHRVKTQSIGEGYLKKIVVLPQKINEPESHPSADM